MIDRIFESLFYQSVKLTELDIITVYREGCLEDYFPKQLPGY